MGYGYGQELRARIVESYENKEGSVREIAAKASSNQSMRFSGRITHTDPTISEAPSNSGTRVPGPG